MKNFMLKRGVRNGKKFCKIYDSYDTDLSLRLNELSDELTGSISNSHGDGIFKSGSRGAALKETEVELSYGYVSKKFCFPVVDYDIDDVLTIEKNLRDRIAQVREWVSSIDHEEVLEFALPIGE